MSDEGRDDAMMELALDEAGIAGRRGEVPVGSVVVDREGVVLARAHNLRELLGDPTAHAEVLAMRLAAQGIGSWRLEGCTLYVTLEPCPMCAGALVNARVERVVYGCDDPRAGALRSVFRIGSDARLNHRFAFTAGVREGECSELLREFFRARRGPKKGAESG